MTTDQIDRCGCHRGCTTVPHECDVPCRWPACLDDDEQDQLASEVLGEMNGWMAGPTMNQWMTPDAESGGAR